MDQLFSVLKKNAWLLAIILLLTSAACTLLTGVGGFDGGFFPVVGNLVLLAVLLVLIAGVAVLLLMKKTDLAKKALGPVFAWWIIGSVIDGIGSSVGISRYNDGLGTTLCVFAFLAGLVLLAAAVLFIVGICGKTELFKLGWLLFSVYLCVYFIVFVMACVRAGVNDYGWGSFVNALAEMTLAAGMFFAGLLAWYKPAESTAEAPAEEPVEDVPAEQPAEETSDEADESKTQETEQAE